MIITLPHIPRLKRTFAGTMISMCSRRCSAAKAATRCLVQGTMLSEIETTLPNGQRVVFPLKRCESSSRRHLCSVIKDAGDDPDCTHGAELIAAGGSAAAIKLFQDVLNG